jgi:hypothetical protein
MYTDEAATDIVWTRNIYAMHMNIFVQFWNNRLPTNKSRWIKTVTEKNTLAFCPYGYVWFVEVSV